MKVVSWLLINKMKSTTGFAKASQVKQAIPAVSMAEMNNNKLERFGFSFKRGGTHSSRTMMLEELGALLAYVDDPEAGKADYLHAIDWYIWDGLRDGFAALVNYHKFDNKLLETLIYTYLGDWISRQKQDIDNGIDGAEEKLAAAENLKKKLELILEGESPHDIFVRWKPIEKQPIGWNPDLNDGVRMNVRPFMTVGDIKKKGAGILRDKPNIKRDKDRGKDVASAPWYQLSPEYGGKEGDRINDHHLSLAVKRTSRETKSS